MNYIITYTVINQFEQVIKSGKMKVKNKLSELHAKSALEDYFKNKYQDFQKMIIYDCSVDNDFFQHFKDITGLGDL